MIISEFFNLKLNQDQQFSGSWLENLIVFILQPHGFVSKLEIFFAIFPSLHMDMLKWLVHTSLSFNPPPLWHHGAGMVQAYPILLSDHTEIKQCQFTCTNMSTSLACDQSVNF